MKEKKESHHLKTIIANISAFQYVFFGLLPSTVLHTVMTNYRYSFECCIILTLWHKYFLMQSYKTPNGTLANHLLLGIYFGCLLLFSVIK